MEDKQYKQDIKHKEWKALSKEENLHCTWNLSYKNLTENKITPKRSARRLWNFLLCIIQKVQQKALHTEENKRLSNNYTEKSNSNQKTL